MAPVPVEHREQLPSTIDDDLSGIHMKPIPSAASVVSIEEEIVPYHHAKKEHFKKMIKKHISETGVDIIKNSPDLDSAYAWTIAVSGFIVNMILSGQLYSFALYFDVFLDEFGQSKSTVSWVGSIATFVLMASSVAAGKLNNRYGLRPISLLGGVFFAAGLFLSSWVDELWYLFATYGIMTGLGTTLTEVSFLSAIGIYFEKNRALANGIYMAGAGMGTIVLPRVIRVLIDTLGWRGALRLLSFFFLVLIPIRSPECHRCWGYMSCIIASSTPTVSLRF